MKIQRFFGIAALLLAIVTTAATAPAPAPAVSPDPVPATAPAVSVVPAAVLEAAAKVTAQAFPDADAVLVDDFQRLTYQADGTGTDLDDYYVKILTDAGRESYRTLNFHYNRVYEKFQLQMLEIVRDGKPVPVNIQSQLREMTEPGQMSSNIYDPNQRRVSVSVPDLRIGDLLHIRTLETTLKPRIPNVWCGAVSLESTVPIVRYTVEVDAPASRPLAKTEILDPVPGSVTASRRTADARIVYTWTARNVPRMFPEPDMPDRFQCTQRLLLSTVPDWPSISRWYYGLCRPRLDAVSPEMRAKVTGLCRPGMTPEQKIMAVFQFVSKEIRYLGQTREDVAPGYEPHPVSQTFRDRHGVCRDKAALLVSLLELAGFKAYPVLFMAGAPKDAAVPNNYFNHAIVAADPGDGKLLLMDPTFENTAELLPSALSNMSYLVAHPEGRTLERSAVVPAGRNYVTIRTDAEIHLDGRLTGRSVVAFDGVNDQIYRDAFSRWSSAERLRFFGRMLRAAIPGATLNRLVLTPDPVRDMARPLRAELEFSRPDVLDESGDDFLPVLPALGTDLGAVNMVLTTLGLEKRKYPLEFFSTCGVRDSFKLKLPPGLLPFILPPARKVEDAGLRWSRSFHCSDGVLSGETELAVDRVRLEPAEYARFKQALVRIGEGRLLSPVFRKCAECMTRDSNAVVELRDTAIRVAADGSVATHEKVRVRVLNYAGVKRFSELKLSYNPAWESVEISDGTVTLPDGKVRKLGPDDSRVFDAPGVAAAPRYPGGKILIVNFPGVEPGAVIAYTLVVREKAKPVFFRRFEFGESEPVLLRRVSIQSARPLRFSDTPYEVERQDAGNTVTFTSKLLPRIPRERDRAPAWMFTPVVLASDGAYRKFSGALLAALKKTASENCAAAQKLGRELAAKLPTAEARVTAIRNFVARHVRAAGPELDALPWSCFSTPDVTLADRYGNSADRAILLFSMLTGAGLPAEFIAAGGLADNFPGEIRTWLQNYPDPAFGQVLVKSGRIYLNDTDQYAYPGTTPSQGMRALSHYGLDRINAPEWKRRRIDVSVDVKSDGSAVIAVKQFCYGESFMRENRRFAEFTPEIRRRYFRELAAAIAPNAEPDGVPEIDFKGYPGIVAYRVRSPKFVGLEAGFAQLRLPLFGALPAMLPAGEGARKTPIWLNYPSSLELNYRISTPVDWNYFPMVPNHARIRFDGGRCRQSRIVERNGLKLEFSLSLYSGLIDRDSYGAISQLSTELCSPQWNSVLFRTVRQER